MFRPRVYGQALFFLRSISVKRTRRHKTRRVGTGGAPRMPGPPGTRGVCMRLFKSYLQHRLNPLHVYCRLRDYGLSTQAAIRLSNAYERFYRVCGLGGTNC